MHCILLSICILSRAAVSVIGLYCLPLSIGTFFHYIEDNTTVVIIYTSPTRLLRCTYFACIGTASDIYPSRGGCSNLLSTQP